MRKIKDIATGLCFGLALAVVGAGSAQAVPFSFEYNDTISATSIPGFSAGQAAKVTVTLDNGNATDISQTWTASNAVSIEWDFNDGGLVTTFTSPFDGGLGGTAGDFETDGTGTLTSVMSFWGDVLVDADFTTNGSGIFINWFLNGNNSVYTENSAVSLNLTNVSNMLDPANWTQASNVQPGTPVPEPGTLALFGLGLVGLGVMNRRHRKFV